MGNNIAAASPRQRRPTEKWSDFEGMDHIKRELTFYASYTNRFPTNGLILFGPPGTGKTTLARGLANKFPKLAFVSLEGEGILRGSVTAAFCAARKHQPSILHIEHAEEVILEQSWKMFSQSQTSFREEFTKEISRTFEEKHNNVLVIIESDCPWKLDRNILKTYFSADIYIQIATVDDQKKMLKDAFVSSKRFGKELTESNFSVILEHLGGFNRGLMEDVIAESTRNRAKRYFASANCTHAKYSRKIFEGFNFYWVPCNRDDPNAVNIFGKDSDIPNIDITKLFIPPEFPLVLVDVLAGIAAIKASRSIPPASFYDNYLEFQQWLYRDWTQKSVSI